MITEAGVQKVFDKARETALSEIGLRAKTVMPDGWRICLAVGWGFQVTNDKDETVFDAGPYGDSDGPPGRLPKGMRAFIKTTAAFYDLFGPENEVLTNKGISYPAR